MDGSLAEIIFGITNEAHDANVIAPKLLQKWLGFIVDEPNQPKLGIGKIEAVPCFEHMLNSFSFDQCAGKHRAKFLRACSRLEALDIYSAWKIKELFLWKTAHPKGVACLV